MEREDPAVFAVVGLKGSFDDPAALGARVVDTFDICDGSEKIRLSEAWSEFARELVSVEGEGRSSGGVGRVWNSVTATDNASS